MAAMVENHDDESVRATAGYALAFIEPLSDVIVEMLSVMVASTDISTPARIIAGEALAMAGSLTDPVIGSLLSLGTSLADRERQEQALGALALGPLSEPAMLALASVAADDNRPVATRILALQPLSVRSRPLCDAAVATLASIATSITDLVVRIEALETLRGNCAAREPLDAALNEIVTTDTCHELRARAGRVLAARGSPGREVIVALEEIVTNDNDLKIQAIAGEALALGGALSEPVAAVLSRITTNDEDCEARVLAGQALAVGDAVSDPVAWALISIAASEHDAGFRLVAVQALAAAVATPSILRATIGLFGDEERAIRFAAEDTFIAWSKDRDAAEDVSDCLAKAVSGSTLSVSHTSENRPGWDYAYCALVAAVEARDDARSAAANGG
jgi:hypothetical protein